MAVALQSHSRLRFGHLLSDSGFEYWDVLDLPAIPQQTDDQLYTVQQQDRIDILANRFYGDPVLWWVIAVANDMELVPADLNEGVVIRIPSPRYILQTFFQLATVR